MFSLKVNESCQLKYFLAFLRFSCIWHFRTHLELDFLKITTWVERNGKVICQNTKSLSETARNKNAELYVFFQGYEEKLFSWQKRNWGKRERVPTPHNFPGFRRRRWGSGAVIKMSHKPPNKRMEDGRDRSLNPFSFHGRRNFSLSSEIKRKMNDNETLATSLPNGSLAFVEPIERPRERE